MRALTTVSGPIALIDRENVDTDAIIPASRTLAVTTKLGTELFGNWRYRPDGKPDPDFVLNRHPWTQAVMLVSGANFGCGSSREQAVWALADFGIRVIFAESFGDIFAANCARRGLLAQALAPEQLAILKEAAQDPARCEVLFDLVARRVSVGGTEIHFDLDPTLWKRLTCGENELDEILKLSHDIEEFQARDHIERPWVYQF